MKRTWLKVVLGGVGVSLLGTGCCGPTPYLRHDRPVQLVIPLPQKVTTEPLPLRIVPGTIRDLAGDLPAFNIPKDGKVLFSGPGVQSYTNGAVLTVPKGESKGVVEVQIEKHKFYGETILFMVVEPGKAHGHCGGRYFGLTTAVVETKAEAKPETIESGGTPIGPHRRMPVDPTLNIKGSGTPIGPHLRPKVQ